jgi:purine-nucleoside phosphorylase
MTDPAESVVSRAESAAGFLATRIPSPPDVAIVLGSGLAGVSAMKVEFRAATSELLGSPATGVAGHAGEVIVGTLSGSRVLAFLGRLHMYEGHSAEEQTLPVVFAARAGAKTLILTNAAGGIRPEMSPGDLMIISDQLNLTGHVGTLSGSMLVSPSYDVYDPKLADLLQKAAIEAGIRVHRGVYAGGIGPSYETSAEIKMLRALGADAVGMSTVLEALTGRRAGMRVAGISVITNVATGISTERLSHADVTSRAAIAGENVRRLLKGLLEATEKTGWK